MKKKHQISIPNPCNEDWDSMQPNGKGRFCESCEYSVQDYSRMSDNELIQLFLTNPPHCGNFSAEQLDRVLRPDQRNLLPTINLRAIAMGFGILITTSALASENSVQRPHVDLIEVLKGTTSLPYVDTDAETDENCHFIVMNSNGKYLSKVKLELLDQRGNVADIIITDNKGMAIYNRKRVKFLGIREIRVIPKSKQYQSIVVPFEGADKTDHEIIRLELQPTKREIRKYHRKRKNYRGVTVYGNEFSKESD